jgi:hypothetical protein
MCDVERKVEGRGGSNPGRNPGEREFCARGVAQALQFKCLYGGYHDNTVQRWRNVADGT